EPPFLAIGAQVGAITNEFSEKSLSEVLRILRSDSFPAQKEIKRSPINLAKLRESIETTPGGKSRFTGRDDNRPAGRSKSALLPCLVMQSDDHSISLFDAFGSLCSCMRFSF